jgi:hypothetical protein
MFGGALPQIFHQTIRSLVTGCFPRTLSVIAKWYLGAEHAPFLPAIPRFFRNTL